MIHNDPCAPCTTQHKSKTAISLLAAYAGLANQQYYTTYGADRSNSTNQFHIESSNKKLAGRKVEKSFHWGNPSQHCNSLAPRWHKSNNVTWPKTGHIKTTQIIRRSTEEIRTEPQKRPYAMPRNLHSVACLYHPNPVHPRQAMIESNCRALLANFPA